MLWSYHAVPRVFGFTREDCLSTVKATPCLTRISRTREAKHMPRHQDQEFVSCAMFCNSTRQERQRQTLQKSMACNICPVMSDELSKWHWKLLGLWCQSMSCQTVLSSQCIGIVWWMKFLSKMECEKMKRRQQIERDVFEFQQKARGFYLYTVIVGRSDTFDNVRQNKTRWCSDILER